MLQAFVNFEGLLPAFDPRQVNKPHVTYAQNIAWETDGPRAGFGGRLLTTATIGTPKHIGSFDVNGTVYYFCDAGVYSYDFGTEAFVLELSLAAHWTDTTEYPWSKAEVGTLWHFYHPNLGQRIIRYDPVADVWDTWTAGTLPGGMKYITQSFGRGVFLGATAVGWSELDDATALTPSLVTGAGQQIVSYLVGGTPLVVEEITDGFIVYTNKGVMKAVYNGQNSQGVYTHRRMSNEVQAVNAFSVLNIENGQHVIVDQSGLFTTNGGAFEPFAPLFSEYLKSKLFRVFTPLVRIAYDSVLEEIYISQRTAISGVAYGQAFVYSVKLERWGQIERNHWAVITLGIPQYGNVTKGPGIVEATNGNFIYFTRDRYYEYSAGGVATQGALESILRIGMIRFAEQKSPQDMGLVIDVAIGFPDTGSPLTFEDWNALADGPFDWEAEADTFEDWGADDDNVMDFDAFIIATNDGTTEFSREALNLVREEDGVRYYSCYLTGVFFAIELQANTVGQTFQLRTLELGGSFAGKLY
jgi:hypothetical protein